MATVLSIRLAGQKEYFGGIHAIEGGGPNDGIKQ